MPPLSPRACRRVPGTQFVGHGLLGALTDRLGSMTAIRDTKLLDQLRRRTGQ